MKEYRKPEIKILQFEDVFALRGGGQSDPDPNHDTETEETTGD